MKPKSVSNPVIGQLPPILFTHMLKLANHPSMCLGLFSPAPVSNWLCSAALSHVFLDSEKLRQVKKL